MKKIVVFIIVISFTFLSCNNQKTDDSRDEVRELAYSKLENYLNSLENMFELKKDTYKYIIVPKDDNLWNISEQYLGTGRRHMDLAMFNYETYRAPSRWYTSGPNPHYDYASAYQGEKLYLPQYAVGPDIKTVTTERLVLKQNIDLNDLTGPVIEIMGIIKEKEKVVQEQQLFVPPLYWLVPFLILFLLILLCCVLQSRRVSKRRSENDQQIKEYSEAINSKLSEIEDHLKQPDRNQHLAKGLIDSANRGGGDSQGYSYLEFIDSKNQFEFTYENQKDKNIYTKSELYTHISQEFPEYEEDDLRAIVALVHKHFQEYDLEQIILYLKKREAKRKKE